MAVIKCKMCGGNLILDAEKTVGTCEFCGTKQTVSTGSDEGTVNLLNRANHFRQQCEFDKAIAIYERMLTQNSEDSEIYWQLVLCRYGIEYVDDPATGKKIPTCHRTQFTSILEDADYLEAIAHADTIQKELYTEEARYIDKVQKGILEIVHKEKPFDVFICYKETDNTGKRTRDSVLAQELYYQLVQEDFKVFFSRITLEDKLGAEYEPYIFAALQSAKVMVVVGTGAENFGAVWVKNEWARYLQLMRTDKTKTIIPAYKEMDPYDLPDALSMFQAQDMSKLGFMQDLIRGIRKIVKTEPTQQVVRETVVRQSSSHVENILKRGMLALEDGDWDGANKFFDQVLNEDVEEPRAYVGKLLAELKLQKKEDLPAFLEDFSKSDNFKKAVRFGDKELEELNRQSIYNGAIKKMRSARTDADYEQTRRIFQSLGKYQDCEEKAKACADAALEYRYQQACKTMQSAEKNGNYTGVIRQFQALGKYKDSREKAKACADAEKEYQNAQIYKQANDLCRTDTVADLEVAIFKFESISDYKDSAEQITKCKNRIDEIKVEEERKEQEREAERLRREKEAKQRKRKHRIIGCVAAFVVVAGTVGGIVGYHAYHNAALEQKLYNGDCSVGDILPFGTYNGEAIEWRVLEIGDNEIVAITEDCICEKAYNEEWVNVTWETCTLRAWLNGDFYNEAFSDEEKSHIAEVTNSNPDNSACGTDGGNDTTDKVYLLSLDEAEAYFGSDDDRIANYNGSSTFWRLRSPGYSQKRAARVYSDGSLNTNGCDVRGENGVRPAITLKY